MATTKTKKTTVNIRPLGDRVLVKRVEAEEKTAGGILLPESAKDKPKEGTVIAIGEGKQLDNGDALEVRRQGRRPRPVQRPTPAPKSSTTAKSS